MRYGADLLGYAVLTFTLQFNGKVSAAGASCRDVNGLLHETGFHYILELEPCTLCICDNGNPKFCKPFFCKYKDGDTKTEINCVAGTCCELICVDYTRSSTNRKSDGNGTSMVDSNTNYDLGLRLIASCITALLCLGLLIFLIHRLRQRKIRAGRQSNQLADDQRSMGSMVGYLDSRNSMQHGLPMDDLQFNGSYPLWKPPSNYFPHGEAPPPYEEAVAAARAEQQLLAMHSHASFSPINYPTTYFTTRNNTQANVSVVRNSERDDLPASSPTLLQSNNSTSASPLISSNNGPVPLSSPGPGHSCYETSQTEVRMASDSCAGACSTTSFATMPNTYDDASTTAPVNGSALSNSASNIPSQQIVPSSNQLLLPNSPNSSVQHSCQQYTTLPRSSGAYTISTSALGNSNAGVHRTIPRTLATSGSLRLRKEYPMHQSVVPLFDKPLIMPKNSADDGNPATRSTVPLTVIPSSVPSTLSSGDAAVQTNIFYDTSCPQGSSATPTPAAISDLKLTDKSLANFNPPLAAANEVNEDGSFDSVVCSTCSAQAVAHLQDDADDYRSECENCKSVTDSKYYLNNEDELVSSPHETMTLQRRPEDPTSNTAPHYYRTSLTLPSTTRQRTRSCSSRGNWFSSMPESSTESSDGE